MRKLPTISIFYGIRIFMNLIEKEHNPPHIHASYQGYNAKFDIRTGKLLDGNLPTRACKLVKIFIKDNKSELLNMWKSGTYKTLKGVE